MLTTFGLAALAASASAEVYFKETFDASWQDRWVSASGSGKVDVTAGDWYGDAEQDSGLQTTQDAKFYHVSAPHTEFSNKDKDLVLQFSVKHAQNIDCGGGYLKFMPSGLDQSEFDGDSEYNIMFGPDICGNSKRVHVIFNYNGENHLIKHSISPPSDQLTHVYTLVVHPDQTYDVKIDGVSKRSGSLTEDWDFLPAKEIKDPEQSKPEDWVDEAMIDDPEAEKPEDWDVPATIVDPDAEMPEDWDEEDDGEWEAPVISNPDYKGPWSAPRIENPDYSGVWEHPMIANPEYEEDSNIYAFDSFGAVGLDVWQVKSGSIFDNIFIGDDEAEAQAFLEETYGAMKDAEKEMKSDLDEAEREAAAAAAAAEADEQDDDDFEEDEEEEAPAHDEL